MYFNILRLAILIVSGIITTSSYAQTRKIFHRSHGGSSNSFSYSGPEVFGLYIPHERREPGEVDTTWIHADTVTQMVRKDTAAAVAIEKSRKEKRSKKQVLVGANISQPVREIAMENRKISAFVIATSDSDSGIKKPLLYAIATAGALLTMVILKLRIPH